METKERIFLAARKRFDRGGIEAVSMRNLAADVGLTPMALYRHYPDKQAIVAALTFDALKEWEKRLDAIEATSTLEWLDREAEAFLDFALQTPRRFEAAFLLASPLRRLPEVIDEGHSAPLNTIVGYIVKAQQEGILCEVPAYEILMTLWGLAQGLISLYRAERFSGGEAAFRTFYRASLRRSLRSFFKPGVDA